MIIQQMEVIIKVECIEKICISLDDTSLPIRTLQREAC